MFSELNATGPTTVVYMADFLEGQSDDARHVCAAHLSIDGDEEDEQCHET
jgi:hypothetical protein